MEDLSREPWFKSPFAQCCCQRVCLFLGMCSPWQKGQTQTPHTRRMPGTNLSRLHRAPPSAPFTARSAEERLAEGG